MDVAPSEAGELKQMRNNVHRIVNSLEICCACQRICECEQWLMNESVSVWLCIECLVEASDRLEKQSGVPVPILHA
jgi:hypothetical protein